MSDDAKLKQIGEAFREVFTADHPLPIPVRLLNKHGKPDGPPILTWRELHASGAFADPVRDAIAEAESAVKRAEQIVRERYRANINGDEAALRLVLKHLIRSGFEAHKAAEAWKPHEYPRANPQPVSTFTKKEDEP